MIRVRVQKAAEEIEGGCKRRCHAVTAELVFNQRSGRQRFSRSGYDTESLLLAQEFDELTASFVEGNSHRLVAIHSESEAWGARSSS